MISSLEKLDSPLKNNAGDLAPLSWATSLITPLGSKLFFLESILRKLNFCDGSANSPKLWSDFTSSSIYNLFCVDG